MSHSKPRNVHAARVGPWTKLLSVAHRILAIINPGVAKNFENPHAISGHEKLRKFCKMDNKYQTLDDLEKAAGLTPEEVLITA